jgi:hypothetical protein
LEALEEVVLQPVFLLVDVVHDGGEHGWLDLSHLGSGVFLPQDLVQPSQASP